MKTPLLIGIGASNGRVKGRVIIIKTVKDFSKMTKGHILVAPMTSPAWLLVIHKAKAVVTDMGGMLSHPAIVCREFGIPAVVGTKDATQILMDGDQIIVDGSKGTIYGQR